ncbi:hypothetical protein IE53DRAFT_76240 [Violaceomyces palustris]|uniref:Uncharacterized protein n=1 Tax=Violaceomyces palustris TaxID=1673888 RepID=A0ACD0P7B5_9BASI|nr:hypothetical protein IE53DRAFT_76240 [Violaceomyces palustris]
MLAFTRPIARAARSSALTRSLSRRPLVTITSCSTTYKSKANSFPTTFRLTHGVQPRPLISTPTSITAISRASPVTMVQETSKLPVNARTLATSAATTSTSSSLLGSLPPGYEIRDSLGSTKAPAPFAVFSKDLEHSAQDNRKYRLITLANGLEALLIHDPEADKAAAAMDVRVGHLSDPEELQGLAHFCEHLLFMGTKKFPRENEYSEFLTNHSGSSNAYTGMENTNYFFDVGYKHLDGALDRFAQFFLQPLFDPSCSEREIRAVDSEHKKNLQSDAWRAFQLEKSLSDPNHPYSHFGTGNAKTLWDDPKGKGMDVRDELLKFHDRYYSANVMKLVVLGRESLDELTKSVVDKFSGVKNKGLSAPRFPSSPLTPDQLKTQVFFRSVKDIRMLDITFPIPDQGSQFRAKPVNFLSHYIGHEGQGSILSHLKNKGWSNHLSAGASNGADGFEFFKITVDLTKEGLRNYEKVVSAVFKYIHLLKSSKIEEWTFNEVQKLCDLAFRFKEKIPPSSYASAVSSQMQMPFPREWILSGPYLTREFDLPLIRKTLEYLSPDRCRVFVAAQSLPDGSKAWDQKEKWYGTEYKLSPLPKQLVEFKPTDFEDLALPGPNSFIPSNFETFGKLATSEGRKPTKRPQLLANTPLTRLWHKRDDQFGLPKANVFFLLRSRLIDATPNNAVKTRLFVELVKDALTEYSYDAELAGLGYNIASQADGIGLSVDGYNDKLPVLIRYILEEVSKFKVDPRRFDIIKDQVKRDYENFQLEAPYQHANYYTTFLLNERMWTAEEKLVEIENVRAEDVQRFLPELLGRLHIEMLVHGNLRKEDASSLKDLAEEVLKPRALSPTELISPRSLILPRGCNYAWSKEVANKENVNSSIEYYLQVGDPVNAKLRAKLALFSQIANEPCFDQLRTKEQLGYLVFSSMRKSIGAMGFRILVQSERDSEYVEGRIEAFLDYLKNHLEKMSNEEFEAQRDSLINKKLESVKNLYEESSRFWLHIHSGYYDFLQRDSDVAQLQGLSKQDVLDFFMEYIHMSSSTRSKLCVHLVSQVKPILFSPEAAEALQKAIESKGLPAPREAFEALKAQKPNVETVKDFARQTLASVEGLPSGSEEEVMALIEGLAKQFPLAEEALAGGAREAAASVEIVSDTVAFKASLPPSRAAVPVRSFEELSRDAVDEVLAIESGKKANL